jgi:hypothetical protein
VNKERANKLTFRGTANTRDAAVGLLAQAGDFSIVERGTPRMVIMRCPCGCEDNLLINLDSRTGPAWRWYWNRQHFTLYPSYWRDSACGSHFIVWNDKIYWCSGWETAEADTWHVEDDIEQMVLAALPADNFIRYEDVAYQLQLIPWDVLQASRQLVRRGLAIQKPRSKSAEFRRKLSHDPFGAI